MNEEKEIWRRTSPLAALFYLGKVLEHITQNMTQTLVPLVAFLLAAKGDIMYKAGLAAVAFVLIVLIVSLLRYWFFGFRVANGSIFIREGVIRKTQVDIKFDRIQAINTQQNIIYRLFNLVTVKFDTAGSSQQEGYLPAISMAYADELKKRLHPVAAPVSIAKSELVGNSVVGTHHDSEPTAVLKLTSSDIVRVGLSNNRALIFLAFLAPLADSLDDWIQKSVSEEIVGATTDAATLGLGLGEGAVLGLAITAAIVIFLATASVIGASLRFQNFHLFVGGGSFRSTGGLLTRHEHTIGFTKIQSLLVNHGLMLMLFRRFRLRARQASSGRRGKCKSFVVPLLDNNQLREVSDLSFQDEFPGLELQPSSPRFRPISRLFLRTRIVLFGLVPCLAAVFLLHMWTPVRGWAVLLPMIWLVPALFYFWRRYRHYGVLVTADGLVLRSGFLGYRLVAFLFRKVQRVTISQSPFQRRKNMSTMLIFLASGSVRVPYVELEKARKLRDFILYRVESSKQAWH